MTKTATLFISLADGTCTTFSGDITQVAMLCSEGGLARYRVRLTPWLWRLTQVRNSRVWQDKSVIDILDDVLGAYQPLAQWRWSGETDAFMANIRPRSYCCQHRETDYEFVQRLLTEVGLAWRAYAAGFPFLAKPEGSVTSIWPTWKASERRLSGHMPFSPRFWRDDEVTDEHFTWEADSRSPEVAPSGVKGYVVALPVSWTEAENNLSGMNLTLLAENPGVNDIDQYAANSVPAGAEQTTG